MNVLSGCPRWKCSARRISAEQDSASLGAGCRGWPSGSGHRETEAWPARPTGNLPHSGLVLRLESLGPHPIRALKPRPGGGNDRCLSKKKSLLSAARSTAAAGWRREQGQDAVSGDGVLALVLVARCEINRARGSSSKDRGSSYSALACRSSPSASGGRFPISFSLTTSGRLPGCNFFSRENTPW